MAPRPTERPHGGIHEEGSARPGGHNFGDAELQIVCHREAYTPTLIGLDGTVYAVNDAKLFAVGQ